MGILGSSYRGQSEEFFIDAVHADLADFRAVPLQSLSTSLFLKTMVRPFFNEKLLGFEKRRGTWDIDHVWMMGFL